MSPILIDETVTIERPPIEVWEALVDPAQRAAWWPYLELDPVPGGHFSERWTDQSGRRVITHGHVTEIIEERLLALRWADTDWSLHTHVSLRLEAVPEGTVVRICHAGWEGFSDPQPLAEQHRLGWKMHLENLRGHVQNVAR